MVDAVIPVLYDKGERDFTTLGLGFLPDWIAGSLQIVEERNGEYYLEGDLPADGLNVDFLGIDKIIYAITAPGADPQPFRIQEMTKPEDGHVIHVMAPHISYQLSQSVLKPVKFTIDAGTDIEDIIGVIWLYGIPSIYSLLGQKFFYFESDVTAGSTVTFDTRTDNRYVTIREALSGMQGSLVDLVGGELEWDKWTVKLHASRGSNTGKVIQYGRNLASMSYDTNALEMVTAYVGYCINTEGNRVDSALVRTADASNYAYPRVQVIDLTEHFQSIAGEGQPVNPTVNDVQAATEAYAAAHPGNLQTVITVEAVPEELQDLRLCDTVKVVHPGISIQQTAKVVKTTFDPIRERFTSFTIGQIAVSVTDTIAQLLMDDENKGSSALAGVQSSMNWRWIQDRIRQDGVSTLPLDVPRDAQGNPTNCDILKGSSTPWVYSSYKPQAIYSWSRKIINISGALKMKIAVNAATDDYITVLTGLPTLISAGGVSTHALYNAIEVHPASGRDFTIDGLYTTEHFVRVYKETELASYLNDSSILYAYVADTAEHWTKVSGSWVRRYTPAGVLQINFVDNKTRNSSFNIANGDIITISTQPYSLAMKAGAHIFPRIYPRDITRASTWIKNHRGLYDYTNNGRWRRQLAEDQTGGLGATDCSGMINQAFRYGAGKSVPDGTKVMIGYGKVVAFARAGEELETSLLREGDIVGWITATASTRLGACHHVGIGVKGMPGDANDTKLRIWHQTTTFICYTQEAAEGDTDKSHDVIPTYQSYIHQSVVAAANGETKSVVYGPQPVASQPYGNTEQMSVSRSDGEIYTDANYGMGGARIVVRWEADSDNLRVPDMNFDVDNIPPDDEAN